MTESELCTVGAGPLSAPASSLSLRRARVQAVSIGDALSNSSPTATSATIHVVQWAVPELDEEAGAEVEQETRAGEAGGAAVVDDVGQGKGSAAG